MDDVGGGCGLVHWAAVIMANPIVFGVSALSNTFALSLEHIGAGGVRREMQQALHCCGVDGVARAPPARAPC